jgi:hypothetical protein
MTSGIAVKYCHKLQKCYFTYVTWSDASTDAR